MSELQTIVELLNRDPFRLGLTIVGFHEKEGIELIQLLNDIFMEIDKKHDIDVRKEADEQRTNRYMEFLQLLKYPIPQDVDNFRDSLDHGDRQTVYHIMHWLLRNLSAHTKRAYLGRFLAPLAIPKDYFANENLNSMHDHYKQLQEQFKVIHKQASQLRDSKAKPNELRKDIVQLEEESTQLEEKIEALKKKTANEAGFPAILEATSALRKEQEEQAKLSERKRDQLMNLTLIQRRANEFDQRLIEMRASLSKETTPNELFERLRTQVEKNEELLSVKIPSETNRLKERLLQLEKALNEPAKSDADIADKEEEVAQFKSAIQLFESQIAEAQKKAGDDKLAIFRQHANVQAKKVSDKEDEIEVLRKENVRIQKEIESLEQNLAAMSNASGTKFMSRDELKQYATTLRNKMSQYKRAKAELAVVTAESVVLHRTEQLLKSKHSNLESFLKGLESKQGVQGYFDTQDKLEQVSEVSSQVNQSKTETLEEISRIVADINQTLKERKNRLAPQIKELRAVRQQFQEVEQKYVDKKAQYDNTAVGLETERIKLEQDCNAFQDDCIREESQYHLLHCYLEIEQARKDRLELEMEFEKGQGRLLRDIPSFQDLYKQKIAQQESLTKELRKQQKTLKSNAAQHSLQRDKFENLYRLLSIKMKVAQSAGTTTNQNRDTATGSVDIARFDVDGANVMTFSS